ncbi:hypothetical protein [Chryseobacterium carnipullorum]|uniref:hypothetical protein n=1 Tax=Chryseobacterium carnipullorum TaxID=1124835 RepID=UPI001428A7FC|nr:hypothetical protein [Chryseobacterium carnipullorum]
MGKRTVKVALRTSANSVSSHYTVSLFTTSQRKNQPFRVGLNILNQLILKIFKYWGEKLEITGGISMSYEVG